MFHEMARDKTYRFFAGESVAGVSYTGFWAIKEAMNLTLKLMK